ncbi:7932_t:CDS:2 [Gigaspora rosea]|nr:7932_t:CDS:2 [Gigaspora rosea]
MCSSSWQLKHSSRDCKEKSPILLHASYVWTITLWLIVQKFIKNAVEMVKSGNNASPVVHQPD